MDVVQFGGKLYHKNCFDEHLLEEKKKNNVTSDYVPNIKVVVEDDVEGDETCDECAGILFPEDESPSPKVESEDVDEKKDDTVTNTPSPPLRRRGR